MSDELDEIRQKRLRELQEQSLSQEQNRIKNEQDAAAFELQKQAILRKILSESAKLRLNNIKLVKKQLADSVENQLIQLYHSGRIPSQISEDQLLMMLKQFQSNRRESSIKFKRV